MRIRSLLLVALICMAAAGATSSTAGAQSNACPPGTTDTTYCQIAPGQYCKGVPKTKLPGHKKTQFAECVSAMAKLNKKPSLAPSQVCASMKTLSKKNSTKKNKAKAKKGFGQCVKAGKQLKLDLANASK